MQSPHLSKKTWMIMAFLIGIAALGWATYRLLGKQELLDPGGESRESAQARPYDAYTFTQLAKRSVQVGKIEIGRVLTQTDEYTSYVFYYTGDGRKISGMLTMPNLSRTMPAIVMARGYVEKASYVTGTGTKNAAAYYAKHGYITLAPDFSGYGESEAEDSNAIGARLRKPVEILDLLASLPSLPQIDTTRVYLWGHSNGGQIMLSVAEILGERTQMDLQGPTLQVRGITLWAPVSKPFPYNVLYFTDEADDKGKWLRQQIALFESSYDVYQYSIDRFWDKIKVPIVLHQGTADVEVPVTWSDELAQELKKVGATINYFRYPGSDHNLKPGWETVVGRDLDFFQATSENLL